MSPSIMKVFDLMSRNTDGSLHHHNQIHDFGMEWADFITEASKLMSPNLPGDIYIMLPTLVGNNHLAFTMDNNEDINANADGESTY